ncbi:hypothetical protein, partial [Avibacterium avium]
YELNPEKRKAYEAEKAEIIKRDHDRQAANTLIKALPAVEPKLKTQIKLEPVTLKQPTSFVV